MTTTGRWRGRTGVRSRALTLSLLTVVVGGCTLEQRSDPGSEPSENLTPDSISSPPLTDSMPTGGERLPLPAAATPEEAAEITLEVFREAVRVGDLSLALSLLHPEAILMDDLVGELGGEVTRGEMLMEVRRRYSEGLQLEPVAVSVQSFDGSYVVSSRWSGVDSASVEDGGAEIRTFRESALVVPSPDGWRIALFHRSRIPTP